MTDTNLQTYYLPITRFCKHLDTFFFGATENTIVDFWWRLPLVSMPVFFSFAPFRSMHYTTLYTRRDLTLLLHLPTSWYSLVGHRFMTTIHIWLHLNVVSSGHLLQHVSVNSLNETRYPGIKISPGHLFFTKYLTKKPRLYICLPRIYHGSFYS